MTRRKGGGGRARSSQARRSSGKTREALVPDGSHDERQSELAQETISVRGSLFVGPLPPPDILAAYKQIQPDMPERFLRLAEKQAAHTAEYRNENAIFPDAA